MICVRRVVSVCERVGLRGSRHDARERRESRGDGSMGGRPRTREDGESVRYKVAAAPRERRSRQARGGTGASASAQRPRQRARVRDKVLPKNVQLSADSAFSA